MKVSVQPHPTKYHTVQLFLDDVYTGDEQVSDQLWEQLYPAKTHILEAVDDIDDDDLDDDEEVVQKEGIPEEFLFESKMIFISNLKTIPQAIGDRCLSIALNYTKDQALDLIQSKMEHLCPEYPELTMKDKQEVIDFMREHKHIAPRFSFRMFITIASLKMSGSSTWKQWAYLQMKEAQE